MTAIWPVRRPEPPWAASGPAPVVVSAPVRSSTWQSLGMLSNWIRGKGSCLVPCTIVAKSIANQASATIRFRVKTRITSAERIWIVVLGGNGTLRAPASTGTLVDFYNPDNADSRHAFVYREPVASASAAEQEITLEINADSAGAKVYSVGCYEQDRPVLAQNSTEYGVDTTTLRSGQPIADFANESLGGVYDLLANLDARRVGIFHWHRGGNGSATWSRVSGTPQSLFSLGVPVLMRKQGISATTGSVKWSAYCRVTAGSAVLTMSTSQSGVSDGINITNTSLAWSSAQTVSIHCDDMNSTDGRQTAASPVWDEVNFALAGDGVNTAHVQAISVWDDG